MSLAFLFHYLMLNMFRMLIHPSSVACDLFVELFRGLYCSGTMFVGVTLWFGWGGVVPGCGLNQAPEDGCINIRNMLSINALTPNDPYRGRTSPLTSKVAFYIFI